MHDRPLIRSTRDAGGTVRGIAREIGASRGAVRRALAPGSRDRYWRPSLADEAEPAVRDVLADYPHLTVAEIGLLIDWRHSHRTLSTVVSRLRPEYIARSIDAANAAYPAPTVGRLSLGTLTIGHASVGTLTVRRPS